MTSNDETRTSEHDTLRSLAAEAYREVVGRTTKATPQELALTLSLLGASFTNAGYRLSSRGLKVTGFLIAITASGWYSFENQRRATLAAKQTKLSDEIASYLSKND